MELKDQVCTVKQSIALDMLDIIKYRFDLSYYLWVEFESSGGEFELINKFAFQGNEAHFIEMRPAWSASELMEILPLTIDSGSICGAEDDYCNLVYKVHGGYVVEYKRLFGESEVLYHIEYNTLALSLAECLIWVIKNNHIKPEDIQ